MKQKQHLKFNYVKWAFNLLFTITVLVTWQFSSFNPLLQVQRELSSINDPVKLEECSVATKQALENNVQIIKIAKILRQEDVIILSNPLCIKWIENNQTLHIAIHSIKNHRMEDETALISLFESLVTVRTAPIGSYENLLNKGLLTLRHKGKDKTLVLEDLNQDNKPEVIFLTSTRQGGALYAFEVDAIKKRLEIIEFNPDDSNESDDFVAIDAKNIPSVEFEKTSSGTIIKTPNTRFSVKNDKWIKETL